MTHSLLTSWLLTTLLALQATRGVSRVLPHLHADRRQTEEAYNIPQANSNSSARLAGIATKQAGYLYGPPLAGSPFFPAGDLGEKLVAADVAEEEADFVPINKVVAIEAVQANASVLEYRGLQTLEDYTLLYDGQWATTLPRGPLPGMLANYTKDLLFSMERLSFSPYQVRRLNPSTDTLQFNVADETAQSVSSMTLNDLFTSGRLFYADYRDQQNLTRTNRYAAACDAYFYIDQQSGDFLPLAIRPNAGSDLVYTPNDDPDDWLLAKMMYNINDFWFASWQHFASTHYVAQIAYLAAIRGLSDDHPVLAVLKRIMYEVFAISPTANSTLFTPGTLVDQNLPYTGYAAEGYTTNLYQNGGWGRFQSNYFMTDLVSRGLLNSTFGPALKSIPFYEDASVIHAAQSSFMSTLVESYYSCDSDVVNDSEIQAWVAEAQGPAQALDFPNINTRSELVDALTHLAHLVSTAHQSINTDNLISASTVLPLQPVALYQPPPTAKNISNLTSFLPPLGQCIKQLSLGSFFSRPFFVGTPRSLIHMFDDPNLLARLNTATQQGAAIFMQTMQEFSMVVSTRTFDADGLAQGMPFLWQALDPNVAPYSITV